MLSKVLEVSLFCFIVKYLTHGPRILKLSPKDTGPVEPSCEQSWSKAVPLGAGSQNTPGGEDIPSLTSALWKAVCCQVPSLEPSCSKNTHVRAGPHLHSVRISRHPRRDTPPHPRPSWDPPSDPAGSRVLILDLRAQLRQRPVRCLLRVKQVTPRHVACALC